MTTYAMSPAMPAVRSYSQTPFSQSATILSSAQPAPVAVRSYSQTPLSQSATILRSAQPAPVVIDAGVARTSTPLAGASYKQVPMVSKEEVIEEILDNDEHIISLLSEIAALRAARVKENEVMTQRLGGLEQMLFCQTVTVDPVMEEHMEYVQGLKDRFNSCIPAPQEPELPPMEWRKAAPPPKPVSPPEPKITIKDPPKEDFLGRTPDLNTSWQNYVDIQQVGTFASAHTKANPYLAGDNTYNARGQGANACGQGQGHWLRDHWEDHHDFHISKPTHHTHAKHHGQDSSGKDVLSAMCSRFSEPVSHAFAVL